MVTDRWNLLFNFGGLLCRPPCGGDVACTSVCTWIMEERTFFGDMVDWSMGVVWYGSFKPHVYQLHGTCWYIDCAFYSVNLNTYPIRLWRAREEEERVKTIGQQPPKITKTATKAYLMGIFTTYLLLTGTRLKSCCRGSKIKKESIEEGGIHVLGRQMM